MWAPPGPLQLSPRTDIGIEFKRLVGKLLSRDLLAGPEIRSDLLAILIQLGIHTREEAPAPREEFLEPLEGPRFSLP